jgi:hypothetical protein
MDRFGAFMGGVLVTCVFCMFAMTFAVESNRNYYWTMAYCTALGGEVISDDICVKDNQIVEIPPRP